MTAALMTAWCAALASLFDVQTVSVPNERAELFFTPRIGNGADLCVLDGLKLTICRKGEERQHVCITLAEGTSVVDVADLDGDGANEVVAVCGESIQRYDIRDAAEPGELFRVSTLLGDVPIGPRPCLLVTPYEGRRVLALARKEGLELRAAEGTTVAAFPYKDKAPDPDNPEFGWSFQDPLEAAPPGSIEMNVWYSRTLVPDMPEGLRQRPDTEEMWRRHRIVTKSGGKMTAWDSFLLRRDGSSTRRVWLDVGFRAGTRIAIAALDKGLDKGEREAPEERLGTIRRYPGMPVVRAWTLADLPDFNNDGYVDLVMARMPEPGMSVESITRMVTGQNWPVHLVVHLFSPEKDAYEPMATAKLEFRVPVTWFLSFRPLRNQVLRDFDGDGRTDIACSVEDRTYAVWLYRDGFPDKPDFTGTFPQEIMSALPVELDDSGRTSIVLRSRKELHLLRAAG